MRHLVPVLSPVLSLILALLSGAATAQVVSVSAGADHSLALHADGTVTSWGGTLLSFGDVDPYLIDVPPLPSGVTYVEVSAGGMHLDCFGPYPLSVARRSDGTLVAWGDSQYGQLAVPAAPAGRAFVEIAAGPIHGLARLDDGSVLAWGPNGSGNLDVPALPAGTTYERISAGGRGFEIFDDCVFVPPFFNYAWGAMGFSVALRSDGAVVAWGDGSLGQLGVPALPAGTTYVDVSAGAEHVVALRSDGVVVAWGENDLGQCDVPPIPAGRRVVGLDAGGGRTVARLDDGTLLGWGNDAVFAAGIPQPPLPAGLTYVSFETGGGHTSYEDCVGGIPGSMTEYDYSYAHVLALRSDGAVVGWGDNGAYQVLDPWTDLGGGTPGVAGVPQLTGSGTPVEGQLVRLFVSGTASSAPTLGWIATAPTPFAALGGTVHAWPYTAQVPFVTGLFSSLSVQTTWPAGIPSGTELTFQFVIQDLSVPAGIVLWDAVRASIP